VRVAEHVLKRRVGGSISAGQVGQGHSGGRSLKKSAPLLLARPNGGFGALNFVHLISDASFELLI
jgi:hypothetical protein